MSQKSVNNGHRKERVVLTNSLVQKLASRPSSSYDVRDSDLKGFMVRVFSSGTKTYRCEYKQGKHYTIGRANILTATQARQEAMRILAIAAKGQDPKAEEKKQKAQVKASRIKQMTFREFLEQEYVPWYEATYPKTGKEGIKDIVRNFLSDLGDLPLTQIDQMHIEKWRIKRAKMKRTRIKEGKKIEEPIRTATINRNVEKLSAVFNKAVEFGFLTANPVSGIKKLKVEQPNRIRFLSEEEYKRLIFSLDKREATMKAARECGNSWRNQRGYKLQPSLENVPFVDHLKPMVLLALGSGIRFGSLIRLEWDKHVDFSQEYVLICLTPDIVKTSKGYEVPLDEETAKVLRQWYEQNKAKHHGVGWMFPGKKPGQHMA
ncbi:MAG: integrase arm-type DNA-binding domain-containing protein [Gammaproteobacteria bacterium]|nr:integrase arm-type DNA-binding domain-containing protein [Gammaproteobacteria bacterium]